MLKRALVQLLTAALQRLQPQAPAQAESQAQAPACRQGPGFRIVRGQAVPFASTRPDRARQLERFAAEVDRWPLRLVASASSHPQWRDTVATQPPNRSTS